MCAGTTEGTSTSERGTGGGCAAGGADTCGGIRLRLAIVRGRTSARA